MRKPSNKEDEEIYSYADLSKYSLKQRILVRLISSLIYYVVVLIGATLRFEPVEGWEFDADADPEWVDFDVAFRRELPAVMAIWHNRLFLHTYYWRKHDFAVMVSKSFDGEYIARCAQRFGYGIIRGSSNRGALKGLSDIIRYAKSGKRIAITVDGPRGPVHKAKRGAVVLAREAGIPVIPLHAEAKRYWAVNSWDKTQIPIPFSRAKVFIGKPVFVDGDADNSVIDAKRLELEHKLDELVTIGEEWRIANN